MRKANDESVGPVILGIIPARAGSKRCPGKNLLPYKGRSLIERAIDHAQGSKLLDQFVVSTDDPEVIRICVERKVLYMRRSEDNASDMASSEAVVREVLGVMKADWVVLLQPTSPNRTPEDIDACIAAALIDGAGAVGIRTDTFEVNGAVYVLPAEHLKAGGRFDVTLRGYPMPPERSLDIDYAEEFTL